MKKKMVQNLKWATAHLSRRLGAGLGAWHSDKARRRGPWHAETAQAAWALARGARAPGARARGAQARGERRWGAGHWACRASGRARQADAGQARSRGARQAGMCCRRAARAHGRQARGVWPAERPGRGLGVQLGQWAVHLVHSACFDPV